jgi:hypothetical protein
MPPLPSICTNPKCGLIFPSPINMEGSDNTFINVPYGICPKCGSVGRIPNGNYSGVGDKLFATLFDISDIAILKDYVAFISDKVNSGIAPNTIRDSVNHKYPELKSLSDLIPKTRAEAYAFIGILIALITLALTCSDKLKSKEPTIEIKQEIINQSFQNYYNSCDSVRIYVQSK